MQLSLSLAFQRKDHGSDSPQVACPADAGSPEFTSRSTVFAPDNPPLSGNHAFLNSSGKEGYRYIDQRMNKDTGGPLVKPR